MGKNREALKKHLEHDEGRRREAYKDSKGYWTIAVGHLLDAEQSDRELAAMGLDDELDTWEGFEITEAQIDELLDIDIDDTLTMLKLSFDESELAVLDPVRYISLFSMAYQLGSVIKFPAMVSAVKAADWDRAADEMLWSCGLKKKRRSQWYKDTPKRCQKMSDGMRWGAWECPEPTETESPLAAGEGTPSEALSSYASTELLQELIEREHGKTEKG